MIPISVIRLWMNIYTPIKYKQEQLFRWYLSFIPTYIQQVFYIQEESSYIEEVYNYINSRPWCECDKFKNNGYYVFVYWNCEKYSMERMILHTDHLKKALHLTDINHLWAFNEKALIKLLHQYQVQNKSKNILDVFLNNDNVYHILHKYLPSMSVPSNVTARILYMLKQCETKTPIDVKEEEYNVMYYTDLLEEVHKKNDEYL